MVPKRDPPVRRAAMAKHDEPPIEDVGDLDALYSPEYLRDCADDDARKERLEELRRRIALDAYNVDPDRIAEELLLRGDLDGSGASS
jgi:anti-sigma28 factor (negative regulator of flagellin synthesis)